MRIIAGEFRSRRLKSPPGDGTRPTPDRMRESLFSILQPRIEGCVFLDAYAGTGAVGIEAISRGAKLGIFVEKNRGVCEVLKENLRGLKAEERSRVFTGKALDVLRHQHADIVFLDPPYELEDEYTKALEWLGEHLAPLVLAQHSVRLKLAEAYGRLSRVRELRQGDNVISFYEPDAAT
ncbi:MAG: 16S rRNA (guanine(966)-N(2))-methyltransferase RsmD [Bryobacteraceae bacterium]|nr:16S rRNA (guanine(966)-N(2))-methyltransferase RsmD [Bryobacteraceae bacterium]